MEREGERRDGRGKGTNDLPYDLDDLAALRGCAATAAR